MTQTIVQTTLLSFALNSAICNTIYTEILDDDKILLVSVATTAQPNPLPAHATFPQADTREKPSNSGTRRARVQ